MDSQYISNVLPNQLSCIEINDDCIIKDVQVTLSNKEVVNQWDGRISKKLKNIISVCQNEELLEDVLKEYLRSLQDTTASIFKDKRLLQRKILKHLHVFHLYYNSSDLGAVNNFNYLDYVEKIIIIVCNLELDIIRHVRKDKLFKKFMFKSAQRIIEVFSIFLINDEQRICHILLKLDVKLDSQSCRNVMYIIYQHYFLTLHVQDNSDEGFCRHYLLLHKLKAVAEESEHEVLESIMKFRFNRTPESVKESKFLRSVLLPSADSILDVVDVLADSRNSAINAYFKYISSKSSDEEMHCIDLESDDEDIVQFLPDELQLQTSTSNRNVKNEELLMSEYQYSDVLTFTNASVVYSVDDDSEVEEVDVERENILKSRSTNSPIECISFLASISIPSSVKNNFMTEEKPVDAKITHESTPKSSEKNNQQCENSGVSSEKNSLLTEYLQEIQIPQSSCSISTNISLSEIEELKSQFMSDREVQNTEKVNQPNVQKTLDGCKLTNNSAINIENTFDSNLNTEICVNNKILDSPQSAGSKKSVEIQTDNDNDYNFLCNLNTPPPSDRVEEEQKIENMDISSEKLNICSFSDTNIKVQENRAAEDCLPTVSLNGYKQHSENSLEHHLEKQIFMKSMENKEKTLCVNTDNCFDGYNKQYANNTSIQKIQITDIDNNKKAVKVDSDPKKTKFEYNSENCLAESVKRNTNLDVSKEKSSRLQIKSFNSENSNLENFKSDNRLTFNRTPSGNNYINKKNEVNLNKNVVITNNVLLHRESSVSNNISNINSSDNILKRTQSNIVEKNVQASVTMTPLLFIPNTKENSGLKNENQRSEIALCASSTGISTSLDEFAKFEKTQYGFSLEDSTPDDCAYDGSHTSENSNSTDSFPLFGNDNEISRTEVLHNSPVNSRYNNKPTREYKSPIQGVSSNNSDEISKNYKDKSTDLTRNRYNEDCIKIKKSELVVSDTNKRQIPMTGNISKKAKVNFDTEDNIFYIPPTTLVDQELLDSASDSLNFYKISPNDERLNYIKPKILLDLDDLAKVQTKYVNDESLKSLKSRLYKNRSDDQKLIVHRVDYDKRAEEISQLHSNTLIEDVFLTGASSCSIPSFRSSTAVTSQSSITKKIANTAAHSQLKQNTYFNKNTKNHSESLSQCNNEILNLSISCKSNADKYIYSESKFSNPPTFLQNTEEMVQHCLLSDTSDISKDTSEVIIKNKNAFLSDHSDFYKSCPDESETDINKFIEEQIKNYESKTCLPLKKRRLATVEEKAQLKSALNISPFKEEISYPATPMISIAELEALKHNATNKNRSFKTPAERKEMPSLPMFYNLNTNEPSPIIADQFNINNHTYNNPTINYHMGNVPVPFINVPCASYYSLSPIILPINNITSFDSAKVEQQGNFNNEAFKTIPSLATVKKEHRKRSRKEK